MKNKVKNKSIIQSWLIKANDDLAFAKVAFKETEFYDQICFLCQQAVEKYLKAVIVKNTGLLRKEDRTHNLSYLAQLCKEVVDLSEFEEELKTLTEYYILSQDIQEIL